MGTWIENAETRVLLVDSSDQANINAISLLNGGFQLLVADRRSTAIGTIQGMEEGRIGIDIAVVPEYFRGGSGLELVARMREAGLQIPVVQLRDRSHPEALDVVYPGRTRVLDWGEGAHPEYMYQAIDSFRLEDRIASSIGQMRGRTLEGTANNNIG